jgi:hypothetical protein
MTVTIQIPASEPTIRRPPGSPDAIDAVARTLYAAAGRYEEFDDLATTAKVVSGWYGDAYEAYAGAAGRAASEHATMAATLTRVAHVCSAHSDTLTDLQRDCDALVDTKVWLDGSRDHLIADVDAAKDATPEEVSALQDRAQTLRTEYRTLVLDHDALQRKVRANEDLMRAAFEGATVLTEIFAPGGTADPLASGAMGKPGAPGTGASATAVAEWWSTLTAAEKEAVIAGYPDVIGNADGLPADARDQANRICLDGDLDTLESKEADGTISSLEQKTLDNARAAWTRPGGHLRRPHHRRDPRRPALDVRPVSLRRRRADRRRGRRPRHGRRHRGAGARHHQRRPRRPDAHPGGDQRLPVGGLQR